MRKPFNGVEVEFPFDEPYQAQNQMMSKIIKSLNNKQNALLESPTGSGKTIALLCSTLAWQQKALNQNGIAPTIYFGTRTHRQINQIVKELKRTEYSRVKMTILGSRDQYCINQEARNYNGGITEACKNLRSGKQVNGDPIPDVSKHVKFCNCSYKFMTPTQLSYKNFQQLVIKKEESFDIEDLCNAGMENHQCPYYLSRTIADVAEIVFCPYNYLLNANIRGNCDCIF